MVQSRFEGVETRAPAAMIGGHNLEDVAITGRGTLVADNAAWRKLVADPSYRAAWNNVLNLLEKKSPVPEELRRTAELSLRADFIRPVESKNVLIEGIHIMGSPMWVLHMLYCENVVIRNVMVESFPGANTDGVDIDSCRHVRISDSYFDTGDDAICLKSGKDADGLRVNRPTEDVAITNCTIHRGHGAVVLGSETSGGIRNVVASNIVAQGTDRGIRIKSTRGRGGLLENIRFDNWIIEDTPESRHRSDQLLHPRARGAGLRAHARIPQHHHCECHHQSLPDRREHRRAAGDAGAGPAPDRYRGQCQGRTARLQHQGPGTAQRADRRR